MMLSEIVEFLREPTPTKWFEQASTPRMLPLLLNDHAHCELKAATAGMQMIRRYPQQTELVQRMSKLVREEMRHFEQVLTLLRKNGFVWTPIQAGRYAGSLHAEVRRREPWQQVDLLIIGALIEARSCERFAGLAPLLDGSLRRFYEGLLASEARHFKHYLGFARQRAADLAGEREVAQRIDFLRNCENRLITEPDSVFRFHSGPLDRLV